MKAFLLKMKLFLSPYPRKMGKFICEIESSDIFLFGGLILFGYGLRMFLPWLSFTVCGVLLMGIGLFMGRGSK